MLQQKLKKARKTKGLPFVIGLQTLTASEHHVCTCTVINTIASVMSNWCCSHSVHNLEMPSDWILFDGLMKIVRKGPRKAGVECVMFLVCFPSDKALESGTTSVREARTRSESPGPRQLQQKLPLAPLVPTAQMSGSDGNEGNGSPRSPTSV